MGGYILHFSVYTMAMIGLIFFALFVYKKFAMGNCFSKKSGFLGVEESFSLAPRKTLYVVKAGNEKFLIASDVDKTTLISKLGENETPAGVVERRRDLAEELPSIAEFNRPRPVLKQMMKRMREE